MSEKKVCFIFLGSFNFRNIYRGPLGNFTKGEKYEVDEELFEKLVTKLGVNSFTIIDDVIKKKDKTAIDKVNDATKNKNKSIKKKIESTKKKINEQGKKKRRTFK